MAISQRQRIFIEEYLKCWNASEAARRAGYRGAANTVGPRLCANVRIAAEIKRLISERAMGPDEILQRLAKHARGDIGQFFRIVEEWTFYPLPTQEIIGAKEVTDDDTDPDNPKTRISYWVRHIVVDMDKIIDPQYSSLINKFTDSPKNGISFSIYDAQAALEKLGKAAGVFTEYTDLTLHLPGVEKIFEMVYGDDEPDPDTDH